MADGIKKISENVIIPKRALVLTNPNEIDNQVVELGALKSDYSNKGLRIKTAQNSYSNFDASHLLLNESITTSLLKNGCVTSSKLADNSVIESKITSNAVTTTKIKDANVTNAKIANLAINEYKIADNSIKESHIKNNAISNNKIADNAINNNKLYNKTITNAKIADATITSSLLANDSVTNAKLANNSVNNAKIMDNSIYGNKIKNASIENRHLAINSINTNNVLNGAITKDKIANLSILEKHIGDKQVFNKHLTDNCIATRNITDNSVTTAKINNGAITVNKLNSDVLNLIGDPVVYDQDNNITTRKNLTVNGNIEAVGTITASKIYNAVFMDLAEGYEPNLDESFMPGDIVEVREDGLLYKANNITNNKTIVGVVSSEYAACYGATEDELEHGLKIPVGLIGKVHVNVVGAVKIGDYITASVNGLGASHNVNLSYKTNHIIGKALESNDSLEVKKVLCQIFPN